jgi:hypothetical protein
VTKWAQFAARIFSGQEYKPAPKGKQIYLVINGSCVFHAWVVNQVLEQASQTPDKYISLEAMLPETMVSGQLSSEILTAGV